MSKTKKKVKENKAKIWFDSYVQDNKIEILIHKAIFDIACQIKVKREESGLSQRDIAKITGLTQTTIVRLEKGKNNNLETMVRVATSLGLYPKIQFEHV